MKNYNFENIDNNVPQTLLQFDNWLLWKKEYNKDGKPTKVPYTFVDGKLFRCAVNDHNNLLPFFDALEYAKENNMGVGFSFIGDGIVGIDVDHCVVNGQFTDLATNIINQFKNTYIEYSPSSTGIHIYFYDTDIKELRGRKNPKNGCECYVKDRFFTVTGNHVPDTGKDITTLHGYTKKFINEFISARDDNSLDNAAQLELIKKCTFNPQFTDVKLLSIINRCNDQKFSRLFFDGDISDYVRLDRDSNTYVPDNSAADVALMNKLAFYTNGNAVQMERLFSQSKLAQRDKWQRNDYRRMTIANALQFWINNGSMSFQSNKAEQYYAVTPVTPKNHIDNNFYGNFDTHTNEAISRINLVKDFSTADVLQNEVFEAAAVCKLEAPFHYDSFKKNCKSHKIDMKIFNDNVDFFYKKLKKNKLKVVPIRPNMPPKIDNKTIDLPPFPDSFNLNLEDFVIPDNFMVDSSGMFFLDKDHNLKKFCNSAIFIVKRIVNIDEHVYKTQLACCIDGRKWILPRPFDNSIIASSQKIISLSDFGLDINSNNAKTMIKFLDDFRAANCDAIPQVESVYKCGWINDDTFITPYTQSDYMLDTSRNSFAENALKQKGDLKVWLNAFEKVRKANSIARFVTAAAFATPLLNILDERSFSIYVNADSKAGKTAAMKFAGSAWGNPDEVAKNFNCTINGLEVSAALRSDFPIIINEKQLAEAQNKRNQLDLTKLLYLIGEGEGKSRMDRNANERKSYRWRTICLANGETDIISDETTQGAITRTLIFNLNDKLLPDDLSRELYRIMKRNYGLAGQLFIDNLLKENFDHLRTNYDQMVEKLIKDFPNHIKDHVRYVAIVALADMLIEKYLFNTKENVAEISMKLLFPMILGNLQNSDELSDVKRELDFVGNWYAENSAKFIGNQGYDVAKITKAFGDNKDSDYLYINAKSLKDAAKADGFNFLKMLKDFTKAGYALKDSKGKNTVSHRLDTSHARCLQLIKEKVWFCC